MKLKRTATFGAVGGALAAWLAGAATSGRRPIDSFPMRNTTAVELRGAELAAEIARLHERLRPTTEPLRPARNLFHFGRQRTPRAEPLSIAKPAPEVMTAPVAPAAPPMKLIGIAEDPGADGPVRTAIISGFGTVFLVKAGQTVNDRYRVEKISGEAVELTSLDTGTTIRLALP